MSSELEEHGSQPEGLMSKSSCLRCGLANPSGSLDLRGVRPSDKQEWSWKGRLCGGCSEFLYSWLMRSCSQCGKKADVLEVFTKRDEALCQGCLEANMERHYHEF